jgi:hypothetical protein
MPNLTCLAQIFNYLSPLNKIRYYFALYKHITQEKLKILHVATTTSVISTLKYIVLVRLPPENSLLHLMLSLIVRNYKLRW